MVLQIIDKKDCQDVRISFYRAQGLKGMTLQYPFNRFILNVLISIPTVKASKVPCNNHYQQQKTSQQGYVVNQVKMFSSECRGGDHRWLLVMFLHIRMPSYHVCYGVNATTCIDKVS